MQGRDAGVEEVVDLRQARIAVITLYSARERERERSINCLFQMSTRRESIPDGNYCVGLLELVLVEASQWAPRNRLSEQIG